jgi:cyclopropane-fatty-acyl-phospholipid synthase
MNWVTLEHGKIAYGADYVFYGLLEVVIALALWRAGLEERWLFLGSLALLGLGIWTLVEYAMHRYVLHGLQPFSRWHGEHHLRPTALISAPTLLSASLIAVLVFLPALLLFGPVRAGAFLFGFLSGYLGFAITHHAVHHWRAEGSWLRRRKTWHGQHHQARQAGCYGVTSALWDHVFGSTGQTRTGDAAGQYFATNRFWRWCARGRSE